MTRLPEGEREPLSFSVNGGLTVCELENDGLSLDGSFTKEQYLHWWQNRLSQVAQLGCPVIEVQREDYRYPLPPGSFNQIKRLFKRVGVHQPLFGRDITSSDPSVSQNALTDTHKAMAFAADWKLLRLPHPPITTSQYADYPKPAALRHLIDR